MHQRLGQQLGNYKLRSLLGLGGLAEVYLGEHVLMSSRQAAIKVLNVQLPTPDEQKNFLNEANIIALLNHSNIVKILECGIQGDTPFLVLEYAPNGTLRRKHPPGTQLSLDVVLSYVKQIAGGLQHAHDKRQIHRDIKPENLLLGPNNEVLISDFGIALVMHSREFQKTQDIVGTLGYMAPEQFEGKPVAASDQYAFGVVIYEWLCGSRPFNGSLLQILDQQKNPPPLHTKMPMISPEIENVIMKALSKDLSSRHSDVQTFANALEQAVKSQSGPTAPPNPILQAKPFVQANPAPVQANPMPQPQPNPAPAQPGPMPQPNSPIQANPMPQHQPNPAPAQANPAPQPQLNPAPVQPNPMAQAQPNPAAQANPAPQPNPLSAQPGPMAQPQPNLAAQANPAFQPNPPPQPSPLVLHNLLGPSPGANTPTQASPFLQTQLGGAGAANPGPVATKNKRRQRKNPFKINLSRSDTRVFLLLGAIFDLVSSIILAISYHNINPFLLGSFITLFARVFYVGTESHTLKHFLGFGFACYRGFVGYALASSINSAFPTSLQAYPLLIGVIAFGISYGIHWWYVSRKG